MLSLDQIAAGLSDRFRLLVGGPRTASERQQTLSASLDWSHDLLSAGERLLLRRLAVFAGGFTLEAAQQVCAGDGAEPERVLDRLGSLVDQSLVGVEHGERAVRYGLLEMLRQYGLQRLAASGEEDSVRARHRDFFRALAEQARPHLETGRQRAWLEVLDREAANLGAAIECALHTDPRLGLRFCAALYRWWWAGGRLAEAELTYSRSLDACPEGEPALRGRVLHGRAWIATNAGAHAAAEAYATEALALADAAGDRATDPRLGLRFCAALQYVNPRSGRGELARGAELARESGDEWALVLARQGTALTHLFESDHAKAALANDEVAALAEGLGDPFLVAQRWLTAAVMAEHDGRFAEARAAAERLRAAAQGVDEAFGEAFAEMELALVDTWQGHAERPLSRLPGQLERALKLGAGIAVPGLLVATGLAELGAGRVEQARVRLEGVLPLIEGRDVYGTAWAVCLLAEARRLLEDESAEETALEGQAIGQRIGNRLLAGCTGLTLGRSPPAGGTGRSPRSMRARPWTPAPRAATRPTCPRVSTPSRRWRRAWAPTGTRCAFSPPPSAPATRSAPSGS